jgi:predicted signal transduction protein with EAL and GGDEF domain
LFLDHLRREFNRAKHDPNHKFAVLFVDIDGFKKVNDSLGHAFGDQLITEIGRRLTKSLRGYDTISRTTASEDAEWSASENTLARLGGDEFTALLVDLKDPSDAIRAAKRIQDVIAIPYSLCGQEIFVSASVGIALSTTPHNTADDLIRDADIAMYRAKSLGKARIEIFDTEMHVQAVNRLKLETELQRAVERQEFRLFYQPIISLDGGRITGFEALLRWQHPHRGLVGPAEFINVAEETGMILPIGKWVLRQACRQARIWQNRYPSDPPLTMSVNISARQFAQSNLTEDIRSVLEESKLPAPSLELEITETVAMGDTERTHNILSSLKNLGVRLAIDDFGTGYSSLNYLRRLPFDTLKIDRSFISGIGGGTDSQDIVGIIVMLARNLHLRVVAEGLETAEHVSHLQKLHCESGQGYFFSKPGDEQTIGELLVGSRQNQANFIEQALVHSDF